VTRWLASRRRSRCDLNGATGRHGLCRRPNRHLLLSQVRSGAVARELARHPAGAARLGGHGDENGSSQPVSGIEGTSDGKPHLILASGCVSHPTTLGVSRAALTAPRITVTTARRCARTPNWAATTPRAAPSLTGPEGDTGLSPARAVVRSFFGLQSSTAMDRPNDPIHPTHPIRLVFVEPAAPARANVERLVHQHPDMTLLWSSATFPGADSATLVESADVLIAPLDGPGAFEAVGDLIAKNPRAPLIATTVEALQDAAFHRAFQAGVRDVLQKPFEGVELLQSVRLLHAKNVDRPSASLPPQVGQMVAVCSPRGGAGKSFLATALASWMASRVGPDAIAILDAVPQWGVIPLLCGVPGAVTTADLVQDDLLETAEPRLAGLLATSPTGVKVVAGPPWEGPIVEATAHRAILGALRRTFPITVVDCPTPLTGETLTVLEAADHVLTIIDAASLASLTVAEGFFKFLAHHHPGIDQRCGLVFNHPTPEPVMDRGEVGAHLGRGIVAEVAYDPKLVGRLINEGRPIVASDRPSGALRAIADIAASLNAVATPLQEPQAPLRRRPSWPWARAAAT